MATLSAGDMAKAIYLSLKDKSDAEKDTMLKNAARVIARRKMLARHRDIISHLHQIINEEKNVLLARVWSKHTLSNTTKSHIKHFLSDRYKSKDVEFEEHIDEQLLGGFKIRIGDDMIDLTLDNKIYKLQKHLNRHD